MSIRGGIWLVVALALLFVGPSARGEKPGAICPTCQGRKARTTCTVCQGRGHSTRDLTYGSRTMVKQMRAVCASCGGAGGLPCVTCAGSGRVLRHYLLTCLECQGKCFHACTRCGGLGSVVRPYGKSATPTVMRCVQCAGDGRIRCRRCHGQSVIRFPLQLPTPDAFICPASPRYPDLQAARARDQSTCILCGGRWVLTVRAMPRLILGLEAYMLRTRDKRQKVDQFFERLGPGWQTRCPPQWRPRVTKLGFLVAARSLRRDPRRGWRDGWAARLAAVAGASPEEKSLIAAAGQIFPELKREFVAIDGEKGDGKLTVEELELHYAAKKLKFGSKIKAVDLDGDRTWDLLEYIYWRTATPPR